MKDSSSITKPHHILNPYYFSFLLMKERLKWDLKLESYKSKKKLASLNNKYVGKKAVIICNGPSLNKTDLNLLKDVYTFGLNKINLLFERSDFRPSCIVSVNSFVIEQNKDFFNSTDIPLFLNHRSIDMIKPKDHISYLHSTNIKTFAKNCAGSINQGGTVTFVAMQLAFHMGFEEVALVGCDHYFKEDGPAHEVVTSGKNDENHFDPNYFANGVKWQLPDIPQSEYSYYLAKSEFIRYNRKIYNCTEGGHLEIFERKSLTDFLND